MGILRLFRSIEFAQLFSSALKTHQPVALRVLSFTTPSLSTMMFSRVAAFAVATLPLLAAATPLAVRGDAGSCSTGSLQCCNSVQSAKSSAVGVILGLLGIVLQDLNVDVGLTCTPITIIGIGNSGW